tara:strand:- start:248 stop:481 length:234 start_codon:yes stop_codon:yes gene_type:complete
MEDITIEIDAESFSTTRSHKTQEFIGKRCGIPSVIDFSFSNRPNPVESLSQQGSIGRMQWHRLHPNLFVRIPLKSPA